MDKLKVGIIRCMQTEDYCPGTTDFKAIRERTGVFEGIEEEIEIVGFINCGGMPGEESSSAGKRTCKARGRYDRFRKLYP